MSKYAWDELNPDKLDIAIKGLKYIVANPEDIKSQELFTENFWILKETVAKLNRTGDITSSKTVKKLKVILDIMNECRRVGYMFGESKAFKGAREEILRHLNSYGINTTELSKMKQETSFTKGTRQWIRQQYDKGYKIAMRKFASKEWEVFTDLNRPRKYHSEKRFPNIYYQSGVEDAELVMLGRKPKMRFARDTQEYMAEHVLALVRERKLLSEEQIKNILDYKKKKGEDIQELTEALLNKPSSSKNKLDRMLENLANGIVIYEKKREK